MPTSTLIVAAIALGMRHALDPDHLVAVSTLVAEERRFGSAVRLAFLWGLGHFLPVLLLGLLILLFDIQPPPLAEHAVEGFVGVVLIALGLRTLTRVWQERVHFHAHAHQDQVHAHFHRHSDSQSRPHPQKCQGKHGHAHTHEHPAVSSRRQQSISFAMGVVHGLAGSAGAALLALMVAETFVDGLLYLLLFGLGVWLGMLAVSCCIAVPVVAALARGHIWYGLVRTAAGLSSIGIGGFIALRMATQLLI